MSHHPCQQCGVGFDSARDSARFCSARCRKASSRGTPPTGGLPVSRIVTGNVASGVTGNVASGGTVEQVRIELERAERLDTYLGASALALAERIDQSTAVMGFAALVRELRSTMAAALAGAARAADPLDEVKARRDRKLAAG